MQKLKPCPFCTNPYPTITQNYYSGTFEIRCPECDIVFRLGAGEKGHIEQRIIDAWNRRKQLKGGNMP